MTQITFDDERAHLHAWELLPWLVNGTASDTQRSQVDDHVEACARCREELARQRALHATMNATCAAGPPLERGLARLQRQIEAVEWRSAAPPRPLLLDAARSRWAFVACGLAAMVLLEAGGLAVLGTQLSADGHRAAPLYRTLSSPETTASSATIRLVVDESMRVGTLQSVLVPLHLQIVGGPSEHGVYSIGPSGPSGPEGGDVEQQLSALRATPGVRFAEPVGGEHD